jgi:SAM-dependent methyltransferase
MTSWQAITRCRGCHADTGRLREALRLDPMPLAGQFCASLEEAQAALVFPLTWLQCVDCGMLQVLEDVSDDLLFKRYNYASSTVGGLVRHFEAYAAYLAQRVGVSREARVLEIGCNDGVLLRRLPTSWRRVGVDPSDVAKAAVDRDYELISAPFTSRLAREMAPRGKFDVITASNCLAHISDIRDVLFGIKELLADDGRAVIEVHDLDELLRLNQWDTIYHEHKAEWSERSLRQCLARVGLRLVDLMRLPLHGGLLRATFIHSKEAEAPAAAPLEDLSSLRLAYQRRRETKAYRLLAEAASRKVRISAYGAAGRANVWLNQVPELGFEYVVDDSPMRAGKILPVVRIPIVPRRHFREAPADYCLITAWNYADDIKRQNPEYSGQWLTAF